MYKRQTIGSSVKSVRILMSDKGELAAYYPEIIGVAANHPDFVTRVKGNAVNKELGTAKTDISNLGVKVNDCLLYTYPQSRSRNPYDYEERYHEREEYGHRERGRYGRY